MSESSAPSPADTKPSRPLWLLPVAAWCAMAVLCAARVAGWTPDDFFITYRYALNLAHGHGFVFNPGERVFGTTDPGLGLLLGALCYVTRAPVPLIGTVVFSSSLVGIAAILLLEGRRRGYVIETILGGSLLMASSYVWGNHGAAAPLALLLLLLAARLAEQRMTAAGVLAGIAVWVRPDAVLGVALLALILWRGKRVPWRFAVAAGCVIAAGAGLAWLYFGSPLPNTLGAKLDMATAAADSWSGMRFWRRASVPISRHFGGEWPAVLIAAACGGWPLATRAGRPGLLLALFGLALAAAYPLLGVPFFSWYILPCLIAAIYGLAFFAGAVGGWLAARTPHPQGIRAAVAVGLFVLLAFTTLRTSWWFFRGAAPVPHMLSYRRGAEWIKTHSAAGDSIAYVEIGAIGYYSERPILDLMGLVSPAARPYVLQNDLLGALREKPTEFVLYHTRGRMGPIVKSRWFKRRYREVMRFEDPGEGKKAALQIYRRRALHNARLAFPRLEEHDFHVPQR
jgi:arabinofuranosyltransferase